MNLEFSPHDTVLSVTNDAPAGGQANSDLAPTGGGFGLQGMRERVGQVGGHVQVFGDDIGWTVNVVVPA